MGYIREPKNVDLVVGPSVLTEATRQTIAQAIARYKKTGQKPVSAQLVLAPEWSGHIHQNLHLTGPKHNLIHRRLT